MDDDVDDFKHDQLELPQKDLTIQIIRVYKQCQILQWMEHARILQTKSSTGEIIIKSINDKQTIIPFHDTCIKIENIVANTKINCSVNLELASCYINNCEYNPRKMPSSMVIRMKSPLCCCIVSKKGNLKLMNCQSEESLIPLTRCFARKLQKASSQNASILGSQTWKLTKPQIQSIKASMDLQFKLSSFEAFVQKYDSLIYEPEIAPYIKISNPNVTMHLFASGKISFLGAGKMHDIIELIELWYPRILEFKKKPIINEIPIVLTGKKREFVSPMNQSDFIKQIEVKKLKLETLANHLPFALAQLLCSS